MKKFMLGFAALSLLLGASSCSNEETVEKATDGSGKIVFSTALGKSTIGTKAGEFTYWAQTLSPAQEIVIHSYPEGSNQEFEEFTAVYGQLSQNGGTMPQWAPNDWYYGADVEQPGYVLRYYSVYPTTNVTAPAATATSYGFEYTVQTNGDGVTPDSDKQEDLIGASTSTIFNYVSLNFNHLLSQVNFAVQGIKGVKIEIDNIAVKDVKDGGSYDFYTNKWTNLASSTPTYGYYPVGGGDGTVVPYYGTALLESGTSNEIAYLGNGGGNYSFDNALMLMPQQFVAAADGQFSFEFSLAISTFDDGNFDDVRATNASATVNFSDFQMDEWLPGKRYVYLIDFTSYLVGGPIRFNVAVNEWIDQDDTNYLAETIHVATASKASIEAAIDLHRSANTNSALTVFPISVAEDPTAAAPVTINRIVGFKAGDVINIEFPTQTGAGFFYNAVPGWTATIEGRVVTLTCGTPNDIADYAKAVTAATSGAGDTVEATDLDAAIADAYAAGAKYFTITAPAAFTADPTTLATISAAFVQGDVIFIVCLDATEAAKITAAPADWTKETTVGNVVILTKD